MLQIRHSISVELKNSIHPSLTRPRRAFNYLISTSQSRNLLCRVQIAFSPTDLDGADGNA